MMMNELKSEIIERYTQKTQYILKKNKIQLYIFKYYLFIYLDSLIFRFHFISFPLSIFIHISLFSFS